MRCRVGHVCVSAVKVSVSAVKVSVVASREQLTSSSNHKPPTISVFLSLVRAGRSESLKSSLHLEGSHLISSLTAELAEAREQVATLQEQQGFVQELQQQDERLQVGVFHACISDCSCC